MRHDFGKQCRNSYRRSSRNIDLVVISADPSLTQLATST